MFAKIIRYFLHNRFVTIILLLAAIAWGLVVSPFNWDTGSLPDDPVPVDAIPNLGKTNKSFTPSGRDDRQKIFKTKSLTR